MSSSSARTPARTPLGVASAIILDVLAAVAGVSALIFLVAIVSTAQIAAEANEGE